MIIERIRTVRLANIPRLLFVFVDTDAGLTGVGETYDKVAATEAAIHETLAPVFLGSDPLERQRLWSFSFDNIRFHGFAGAELRALSALEIALWDLQGKALGVPLLELLGGPSRPAVPTYNTAIGHGTVDDFRRWKADPTELAAEYVEKGIRGIKVWPFDGASVRTSGSDFSPEDLHEGLFVVDSLIAGGAGRLRVAIECHSRFSRSAMKVLLPALAERGVWFVEDPMPATSVDEWCALRSDSPIPLVGSETLLSRWMLSSWISRGASDVVMTDVAWTGGVAETVRIAAMAEAHGLPIMLHNAGGPISHAVNVQLAFHIPNLFAMETVRAFAQTYFQELSDVTLSVKDGVLPLGALGPGLGVTINEDALLGETSVWRTSERAGPAKRVWSMGDAWEKTELRL